MIWHKKEHKFQLIYFTKNHKYKFLEINFREFTRFSIKNYELIVLVVSVLITHLTCLNLIKQYVNFMTDTSKVRILFSRIFSSLPSQQPLALTPQTCHKDYHCTARPRWTSDSEYPFPFVPWTRRNDNHVRPPRTPFYSSLYLRK